MEHFGSSHSSCTAMLVGKKATIDGSTIIARDEDGESGINQKLSKSFQLATMMKSSFLNTQALKFRFMVMAVALRLHQTLGKMRSKGAGTNKVSMNTTWQ